MSPLGLVVNAFKRMMILALKWLERLEYFFKMNSALPMKRHTNRGAIPMFRYF